ncbi:MAG: ATP-binding protein [Chloroflexota bacterium]|nr:ATP-binding protein [Chloroflexota bacterium]
MNEQVVHALVVDANIQQRLDLCAQVLKAGYKVIEARDGATALRVAQAQPPTVIIAAYDLSDCDAYQFCVEVRKLPALSTVPVALILPFGDQQMDEAYAAGADDVLELPVSTAELKRRLRLLAQLGRARAHSGESERRAHQFFHDSRAAMLLVDPASGLIVDANRVACNFYGYRREELLAMRIADLDAPHEESEFSIRTSNLVLRHRLANGQIRDVSVYSGPVEMNGRKHVCMIVHDVTKRKLAEVAEQNQRTLADALRLTAASLTTTLDHDEVLDRILASIDSIISNRGVGIMLINGDVTQALRLRGYERAGVQDVVMTNLRFKVEDTYTLRTVMKTGAPIIIPDVTHEPNWVEVRGLEWVRSHMTVPIRINRETIGFLNIDNPVPNIYTQTDAERLQAFADQAAVAINNAQMYRKVREQAVELEQRVRERTAELNEERAQLSAILDSMSEGVLYGEIANGRLHLYYANRAMARLTGYSEAEWRSDFCQIFQQQMTTEELDALLRQLTQSLNLRGWWKGELSLMRKDASQFLASASAAYVERPNSNSIRFVGVLRDVSQEKALAEQKARFVAHASHELRTPLTNVKTRLYLMRKQPEKLKEHMRVLEDVADRMRRLVEDLLDLSRFERGALELQIVEQDLCALLTHVVELQRPEAEHKGLVVHSEIPDSPIMLAFDYERLTQVLTNLLTNAINYTAAGGQITVRLCLKPCENANMTCAIIKVEDTGVGIAEEHLPSVFQPFFRVPSDVQGTGLGLSIAREIVQMHGGDIFLESTPGKGTTFTVKLPQFMREAVVSGGIS